MSVASKFSSGWFKSSAANMKINILSSLLLLSFAAFVTSQATEDQIKAVEKLINDLTEGLTTDKMTLETLKKLLPLDEAGREKALALAKELAKIKEEYEEKSKPSTPEPSSTPKPDEPTTKKPEEATTKKPEEATTKKPEEATTKKPEEATTKKPEESTTKKPEEGTTKKPEEPTTKKPEEATTKKPEEATTKKPEEATTKKPEEGTTKKPEESTTKKPEEATTKKPEEETTKKPANTTTPEKPTDEKDAIKTFVMIVKDIKSTTKKTFTSIKDLIKNGLKGKPRQPLIKKLIDQVKKDGNSSAGKPVYIIVDPKNGLKISSNAEEVANSLKELNKKQDEKKKDEDEDEDEDEDDDPLGLLPFLDLEE